MKNSEKFIKNWEKNRQKGKVKYVISSILIYSTVYWVSTIIIDVITGYGLSNLSAHIDMFIAVLIGSSIGIYLNWYKNERKYNEVMRNK